MNYHDDEEDQRFIDALGCTFVRTETRTTRFERKCEGCPQVIRPGESTACGVDSSNSSYVPSRCLRTDVYQHRCERRQD